MNAPSGETTLLFSFCHPFPLGLLKDKFAPIDANSFLAQIQLETISAFVEARRKLLKFSPYANVPQITAITCTTNYHGFYNKMVETNAIS